MVDRHYFEVIWFCLALTLAISLSAIGLVILYDYAAYGANLAGRITFRPGGGILSLLTSATLLALIFRRKSLSTSLAVGLSVTAITFVAIPPVQGALLDLPEALTPFRITPLMTLVSLLIAASVLATLHSRKGPLVGSICGLLTILLGVASLLSHWIPQLQPVGQGSVPDSTIVAGPLVILLGLILPGLQTLPRPHTPTVSKGLILIGVFGIAVTTVSWHVMRLQHSANMQQRAEQLASQMEVFAPGNSLPAGELYLPPLILFTGLGLSFLVLLSHVFWRESEHRATKLESLNKALNFYLEQQATIFESITDAFFTLDRNWHFTYVNKRSEELLKRPRHELLGHSIWDEFPDAVGSEFESQYHHAMASGESVAFEAYYPPLETWFEVSAYPSEEGLGVYYRSVTERIEAQKRLNETMAELERSNKELRDFAFAASHDLQEPLRKIQAFSDRLLITSESLGEQDKDYLKRMQSAANRMQSLIQDLLTYSRVTTRAKPFVTCNTNQILSEVLQDMETTIARENATLETRPLPHVKGDPTQIRQVLQNLLSNAVKFHNKDKAPVVLVYSEHETSEGWTLVVSDNGIGFDGRYADKLFDPFQRLHQRQDFAGTGIGMAIVKKILDRHGATVSVDSAPDRGTTFKIRFEHG